MILLNSLLVIILGCSVAIATGAKVKVAVYEHVVISPDDPEDYFPRREAFRWMSKNLDVLAKQAQNAAIQVSTTLLNLGAGMVGTYHSIQITG